MSDLKKAEEGLERLTAEYALISGQKAEAMEMVEQCKTQLQTLRDRNQRGHEAFKDLEKRHNKLAKENTKLQLEMESLKLLHKAAIEEACAALQAKIRELEGEVKRC